MVAVSRMAEAAMVVDAIRHLNASYGRGDIVAVNFDACTFARHVPTTHKCGFDETRKMRIDFVKGIVYALGHQRKLTAS
jgi:hypothetical protein